MTREDCISRQAVKDIIYSGVSIDTDADKEYVCELIDKLPSVTPKEKTGHKVKEEAKEQTPIEQTLDFFKNLYLQNKEEVDKVAREFEVESEVSER